MQSGHDLTTATESVAALKSALSSSETFSKHYLVCCNIICLIDKIILTIMQFFII